MGRGRGVEIRFPENDQHFIHAVIYVSTITFLSVFGGFNDITAIYSKHSPRNFTPSQIGYFFAEVLFLKGVGVVLGIPLMNKVLNWSDLTIAITGAFTSIGLYIFLGLASKKWMMFVGKYQQPLRFLMPCFFVCSRNPSKYFHIVAKILPSLVDSCWTVYPSYSFFFLLSTLEK